MKATKEYKCKACGTTIAKGDEYDRLWLSSTEVQHFCMKCKHLMVVPRDGLMWVGADSYPTIASFVDEAKRLGVNKRIPAAMQGVSSGSRIFLIHDEGLPGEGQIFGFFVVQGIILVVPDDASQELVWWMLDKLAAADIQPVKKSEADTGEERLCGHLVLGATYYYSKPDMEKVVKMAKELAAAVEVQGGIITFKHPLPYSGKRFRGLKYLEPRMIPALDDLGITIHPWRSWEGYKVKVAAQVSPKRSHHKKKVKK